MYEQRIQKLQDEIKVLQETEHKAQEYGVWYREKLANRPKLSERYKYSKNVKSPYSAVYEKIHAKGYPWRIGSKIALEAESILTEQGYATQEYSLFNQWTTNADDGFESVHVNDAVDEAIKKVKAEHPEWWYYGE